MKPMSKIQRRLAGLDPKRNSHGLSKGLRAIVRPATPASIKAKEEEQAAWDNPKRVIFMSRDDVKRFDFDCMNDVLISISDTGVCQPAISKSPKDLLAIDFHDWVPSNAPEEHHWYMAEQARQVAAFVLKHTEIRNVLIHCNYGESRSKAMALAIKRYTNRSIFKYEHGYTRPYKENGSTGNERVFDLTAMMLLRHSEDDAD